MDQVEAKQYSKHEDLKYPFGKSQLIKSVLDMAKGGHVSIAEFIQTFVKFPVTGESEWDEINDYLWQDFFKISRTETRLEGCSVRYEDSVWQVVSDVFVEPENRLLSLISQENPEIKKELFIDSENKQVFILKEDMRLDRSKHHTFFVKNADLSEEVVLNHLIRCLKSGSGLKNKQAFTGCLRDPVIDLNGEKQTLYSSYHSPFYS